MRGIYEPIRQLSAWTPIQARVSRREPVLVSGVGDSVQNHLTAALTEAGILAKTRDLTVILTPNDVKAQAVFEDMNFYFPGRTFYFPAKDPLFYSADVHGSMIEEERAVVLKALENREVSVLVMSVEALYDRMVPQEIWESFILHKRMGGRLELTSTVERLVRMGYDRVGMVEGKGQFSRRGSILDVYPPALAQFAVRGGLIDIFPMTEDNALRIELWDDEIDSIRVLDIETQRSQHRLADFTIFPAGEIVLDEERILRGSEQILSETKAAAAKLVWEVSVRKYA